MINSLFISVLLMLSVFSSAAFAKELSTYSIRKVVYANELQEQGKLNDAIKQLKDYQPRQAYDKAYIQRMLGNLYWQVEQPEQTIKQLTLAVDANILEPLAQRDTLSMLADILLSQGHYKLAEARYIRLSTLYEDNDKKLEEIWLRISQAQYQQQKWSDVESSVGKQQHYQRLSKLTPKTLPLQMLLSAQMAQKKWQGAINTTGKLREMQPQNGIWWRQLTSLYLQIQQHRQALITLQQQERAGFVLNDQQLALMTQLYAQSGVPYKAAQTVQRLTDASTSAERLAEQAIYWQQAKEWQLALQSWQKAAHYDEKYYRQFALLSIQQRELQEALAAINKISRKDAQLLLIKTQILSEMGQTDYALNTVTQAHQLSPSATSSAWIKFLTQVKEASSQ